MNYTPIQAHLVGRGDVIITSSADEPGYHPFLITEGIDDYEEGVMLLAGYNQHFEPMYIKVAWDCDLGVIHAPVPQ